jgi:hypothetical protein
MATQREIAAIANILQRYMLPKWRQELLEQVAAEMLAAAAEAGDQERREHAERQHVEDMKQRRERVRRDVDRLIASGVLEKGKVK